MALVIDADVVQVGGGFDDIGREGIDACDLIGAEIDADEVSSGGLGFAVPAVPLCIRKGLAVPDLSISWTASR
jgi:hypothetical protein